MKSITRLIVTIGEIKVGEMAIGSHGQIGFQYSQEWLDHGYSISPINLKFDRTIQIASARMFGGLYGVFSDSLPDGWGMLLMDRFFRKHGVDSSVITPLDRLAYIGSKGMGALEYHPEMKREQVGTVNLADLAASAEKFVHGDTEEVLNELMITGGSPGGARPKVVVAFSNDFNSCISGVRGIPDDYSHWLVKFHSQDDGKNAGIIEKIYAEMAAHAGLNIPNTKLIEAGGKQYFACCRFDRVGNARRHVITMTGLLHADFRLPSLDYEDILGATGALTRDIREVEMAYRMGIFNVLCGNRDDHAKNFAFIMDDRWKLAPSYDLTFSSRQHEHSTSMSGSGLPVKKDMDRLAAKFNIKNAMLIQQEVRDAITMWDSLAKDRLPAKVIATYRKNLADIDRRAFGKMA